SSPRSAAAGRPGRGPRPAPGTAAPRRAVAERGGAGPRAPPAGRRAGLAGGGLSSTITPPRPPANRPRPPPPWPPPARPQVPPGNRRFPAAPAPSVPTWRGARPAHYNGCFERQWGECPRRGRVDATHEERQEEPAQEREAPPAQPRRHEDAQDLLQARPG